MTIRFSLPLTKETPSERFAVEISGDGEITFPGYEERLEYDQAFAAMGGDPSNPLILMKRWEIPVGRSHVISHNLGLGRKVVRRIAADCAAHVADCYESGVPNDGRFREALSYLGRSIEHDIPVDNVDRFLFKAQGLIGNMEGVVRKIGYKAVTMAHDALFQSAERIAELSIVRSSCAMARAYLVASDDTPEWSEAAIEEEEWQIRRFHDVVEAMQQKKKWPPLEATK